MIAGISVRPLGYQQIRAATLAAAQLLTVPASANYAVFRCEGSGASVRWRDDGTAPIAAIGIPLLTTDQPYEFAGNLSAIQFILSAATPILNVSYYKFQ